MSAGGAGAMGPAALLPLPGNGEGAYPGKRAPVHVRVLSEPRVTAPDSSRKKKKKR